MNYIGYDMIACITYWRYVYLDELDNFSFYGIHFLCLLWIEKKSSKIRMAKYLAYLFYFILSWICVFFSYRPMTFFYNEQLRFMIKILYKVLLHIEVVHALGHMLIFYCKYMSHFL